MLWNTVRNKSLIKHSIETQGRSNSIQKELYRSYMRNLEIELIEIGIELTHAQAKAAFETFHVSAPASAMTY